jgi:hypothetical protein
MVGCVGLPDTRAPVSRLRKFMADAAAGTLPSADYVDPKFVGEEQGITNDDHPCANIRTGQAFLDSIYRLVANRCTSWIVAAYMLGIAVRNIRSAAWQAPSTVRPVASTPAASSLR